MSAQNEALEVAESLCKQFEGFSAVPYICPAGMATIGYGAVFKPDGSKVLLDHPAITKETAEEWLRQSILHYMTAVIKLSPILLNYPQKLGAITSFAYNLGATRYKASTLRVMVNEESWHQAVLEIKRWTRGGGKVLPGLVRRRKAESLYLVS
tara:strand:+ start:463 stop:921 length:459 start_codon:yes stop_codon:yes gene_type:complete